MARKTLDRSGITTPPSRPLLSNLEETDAESRDCLYPAEFALALAQCTTPVYASCGLSA